MSEKMWDILSVDIPIPHEVERCPTDAGTRFPSTVVVDVRLGLNPHNPDLLVMKPERLAEIIMGTGRQADEIAALKAERDELIAILQRLNEALPRKSA